MVKTRACAQRARPLRLSQSCILHLLGKRDTHCSRCQWVYPSSGKEKCDAILAFGSSQQSQKIVLSKDLTIIYKYNTMEFKYVYFETKITISKPSNLRIFVIVLDISKPKWVNIYLYLMTDTPNDIPSYVYLLLSLFWSKSHCLENIIDDFWRRNQTAFWNVFLLSFLFSLPSTSSHVKSLIEYLQEKSKNTHTRRELVKRTIW